MTSFDTTSIDYVTDDIVNNDTISPLTLNSKRPVGKPPLNLSEKAIRYAMENTWCNAEAGRFLGVCRTSYMLYARKYIDAASGLTLYDLHKKKGVRPKVKVKRSLTTRRYKDSNGNGNSLENILKDSDSDYPIDKLRERLFLAGWFIPQCSCCGWDVPRATDGCYPIMLDFVDGNWRNKQIDNLYMLCLNCYFLSGRYPPYKHQGWSYGKARGKTRADGLPHGSGKGYTTEVRDGILENYRDVFKAKNFRRAIEPPLDE